MTLSSKTNNVEIPESTLRQIHRNMRRTAYKYFVAVFAVVVILYFLNTYANVQTQVFSLPILLGVVGAYLALIGNNYTSDALGRYTPQALPQWKWGTKLQAIGFVITLFALILK